MACTVCNVSLYYKLKLEPGKTCNYHQEEGRATIRLAHPYDMFSLVKLNYARVHHNAHTDCLCSAVAK